MVHGLFYLRPFVAHDVHKVVNHEEIVFGTHHVIVVNRFSEENVLRDDIKLKDCLVVLVLVFAVDKALFLLVLKEVAVDKLFGVDVVSL